jgi:hypothetical protein
MKKNILYREKDLDAINERLPDIIEESEKMKLSTLEPTINEFHTVMKDVVEFIKEKKRIIYGGYGLNLLLKAQNPNDAIYNEWTKADTEFYSYTPITDLVELCDYLYKKGYKHVQGQEGVHKDTYKLFVNFENYCDISYCPKFIYDNIPIVKHDGFLIVHPHIMFLDKLRMFDNPLTASWRFQKEVDRTNKILKYYPLSKIDCSFKKEKYDTNVSDFIRKNIISGSDHLVTGFYAYFYYMYTSKLENDQGVDLYVPYYDVICDDLVKTGKDIYNLLKKEYGNKISTKEYYPFFQYLSRRISYYYEDKLILNLYDTFGVCHPYNNLEKKKIKVTTFLSTLMFLMFFQVYHLTYKNVNEEYNIKCMISNMIDARYKYLEDNGLTVIDKSPFQDFVLQCMGTTIDPIRERRLSIIEKKKKKQRLTFSYSPPMERNPKFKPEKYVFSNLSGNIINNMKYRIIDGENEELEDE